MWAAALSIAWISYVFANYTTQPPCCRDHLGTPACGRLLKSNPRLFARRCNTEAEFRLIQCCSTCNKSGLAMAYDLIARSLVDEQCFDRYGKSFCSRYINATDVFEPQKRWTCDGENPQIAFRTCRKSCGFCDFNIVSYRLEAALKASFGSLTAGRANAIVGKAILRTLFRRGKFDLQHFARSYPIDSAIELATNQPTAIN